MKLWRNFFLSGIKKLLERKVVGEGGGGHFQG